MRSLSLGAQVVYGDTDSMFVHLPGRSRAEAFRIGAEIAAAVTAANPQPVKLQLEKVYQPCILATKKRYVGFSYESPSQAAPLFDAKGIETVRRDTCAAVSKTLERALRLLFATRDLSRVKAYLQRQWARILAGRLSLADATFAKEVRMHTYAAGKAPAAAIVAARACSRDPRLEPHYGQRVPYVVCCGPRGTAVSQLVHAPQDVLASGGALRINAQFYIDAQGRALARLLALAGADVQAWLDDMARMERRDANKRVMGGLERELGAHAFGPRTLTVFFRSDQCAVRACCCAAACICRQLMRACGAQVCGAQHTSGGGVCPTCKQAPAATALVLMARASKLQTQVAKLRAIWCGGKHARVRCVRC